MTRSSKTRSRDHLPAWAGLGAPPPGRPDLRRWEFPSRRPRSLEAKKGAHMSAASLRIKHMAGRPEDRPLRIGTYRIGRDAGDIVFGDANVSEVHGRQIG